MAAPIASVHTVIARALGCAILCVAGCAAAAARQVQRWQQSGSSAICAAFHDHCCFVSAMCTTGCMAAAARQEQWRRRTRLQLVHYYFWHVPDMMLESRVLDITAAAMIASANHTTHMLTGCMAAVARQEQRRRRSRLQLVHRFRPGTGLERCRQGAVHWWQVQHG